VCLPSTSLEVGGLNLSAYRRSVDVRNVSSPSGPSPSCPQEMSHEFRTFCNDSYLTVTAKIPAFF
jgi:hypothetical protein